ncbi:response regulator transcription factor [Carboxydothermus ferrireducens]|uniref:Stage 0 sporulation protein A homolog n=1 Tax=Carboxydothermus ferrireducens DSM 11255 TaxID=1119529 RepID=A0ABX2R9N3_9THEO|nr:response regulator transcription factor [Carboxydothermus ferrireducens]NYE56483.1 DNA-binding response OmpR family regulator [Carboxydothermus ferrireducens DSM 11255]
MYKILVVEDDQKIQKALAHLLKAENYDFVQVYDGEAAVEHFYRENFDLVILDLNLPKQDGFSVLKEIKNREDVPVIILTARGEEMDKITGFTLGVDDYLTKPFSPAELMLRIKAVLRRYRKGRGEEEILKYGKVAVNLKTREVLKNGETVELTSKEYALLELLFKNPNRVFTKEQIMDRLWPDTFPEDPNIVSVLVRRLREKIEEDPSSPRIIKTVWGVGYKAEKI